MKQLFWLITAVALLIAAQSLATEPTTFSATGSKSENQLPFDSTIVKGRLANGLTYLIRRNHKPEKRLFLRLVVKAGSVLEEEPERGIAHFCEHMAFNGTSHFKKQELVDYLESIGMRFGADLNAYTSFDETVYFLEVPTDSLPLIETAFQILEDWAHNVLFDSIEVEKERGVVIEEWRRGRGPFSRIREKILPVLLKDSRYAERLPIGTIENLRSFPPDVPTEFYKKWYRPDLMGVLVVGDYDPIELQNLVVKHFSRLGKVPHAPERKLFSVPAQNKTLFALSRDPEMPVADISIYYKHKPDTDRTVIDYRESTVKGLVFFMLNDRLMEKTAAANPPYNFAYCGDMRTTLTLETFVITARAQSENILTSYKTLLTEVERVRRFGFTASELERTKKSYLKGIEKQYIERNKQNSSGLISELQRHFLYDEPVPGIAYEYELVKEILPSVTVEEVNATIQKMLANPDRVITITGPQKAGLYFPDKDTLQAILAEVKKEKLEPYSDEVKNAPLIDHPVLPGKIIATDSIPQLGILVWKLSNGAQVFLKSTNFKNDEIRLRALSSGGRSLAPDSIYASARFATALARESGLGQFNKIQLKKLLADKFASVSANIGNLTEELRGYSTVSDFETMLQLLYLKFTAPRFDSTAFKSFIAKQKDYLKNKSLNPSSVYRDSIRAILTQRHPRFQPVSLKTLEQVKLQAAERFYRERFANAGDFTFIFVGSFDPHKIRPLIEKYIGGLPGKKTKEHWKNVDYTPPSGKVERTIYRGMEPKSSTTIVLTGNFDWNLKNLLTARFLADILEIKLRERLREEKSGTYSVGVWNQIFHYPNQRYEFYIAFSCDPERVDELTTETFVQIDSLRRFGTTEKYLQKVREMYLKDYEEGIKRNGFWLGRIGFALFNEVPLEHVLKLPEIYRSIDLKSLQQMAKKLLNSNRYIRIVLLPEKLK